MTDPIRAERARAMWANPETRKRIQTAMRASWERRHANGTANQSPEARRAISETMRERWADPEFRAKRPKQYAGWSGMIRNESLRARIKRQADREGITPTEFVLRAIEWELEVRGG